ncbi:hypothetical protein Paride_0399 [Pseudomonas phage Paride]|nr:hypothetical protein Paride_0399 [Pseudomonas phage Paride]
MCPMLVCVNLFICKRGRGCQNRRDSYRKVFDKAKQTTRIHPFVLRMFCMCTVCIQ